LLPERVKPVRIMKLFLMLIIIVSFQFGQRALAQQVTIRKKNIALTDVFKEIHKQTGYGFIYSDKLLLKIAPVNIDITNESVDAALRKCLEHQPLSFTIENRIVTIIEKITAVQDSNQNSHTLSARIIDESENPIPSATVRVLGKERISITNYSGKFSISNLKGNDILEISCIGYKTRRISAASGLKVIKLEIAESKMDEVQVIAYGQTNNRLSTGSVTTVTAKDLKKTTGPNVLESLAGIVPGLSVVSLGTGASSSYRISLRGTNTIGAYPTSQINSINAPLVLLDGLPLSTGVTLLNETGLLQSGLVASGMGQSPIFNINPDDIESISVLKDADATSIYGSMGANGVILITSKKPIPGKLQVHSSVNQGISMESKRLNLFNSADYFAMRNEAFANDNSLPTMANAYDLLVWDKNRSTDWQKKLLGSRPYTSAQLGVSGGNDNFSYRLNASYYYNDQNPGLSNAITNLFKEQRGTTDLSLSHQSKDGRLIINFRGAIAYVHDNLPHYNPESSIYLAPNAPSLLDATGKLNWEDWRAAKGFSANTLGLFKPYKSSTHDENFNTGISYHLTNALEISALGSYRKTNVNQFQVEQSAETTDPLLAAPLLRSSFGKNNFRIWSAESNVKYTLKLKQTSLQFLAGIQYNRNVQKEELTSASGWPDGFSQESTNGAGNISVVKNDAEIRMASTYGRITYNYADKYILNLNARRDGSSNFGEDKKYGNFGSVGAAWILTRESWMRSWTDSGPFSLGKLRASLGTTGLVVALPYTYTSTIGYNPFTYQGQPANAFIQPANPDVKWTQTRKLDVAVDLGFFNDQLLLSVDHYNNRTSDIITLNPVTTVTGFSNLLFNQPASVENTGTEISLNYRSGPNHQLTWSIGGNISFNKNKLVAFPNLDRSLYSNIGYVINESVNRYFFAAVGTINPQTGGYVPGQQASAYYTIDPDFTGGVQTQINYKRFDLSFNITFARQKGLNAIVPVVVPGTITQGISNQPVSVGIDHWQATGDIAQLPKFSSIGAGSIAAYQTSRYLNDASYVSLKNARLRYTLDRDVSRRLKMSVLSASLTGHNLMYITKFKGINPELPIDGVYLIKRLFDLSVDLTF
jgi:TonB-linked SusC/RagA family outer membrane protein